MPRHLEHIFNRSFSRCPIADLSFPCESMNSRLEITTQWTFPDLTVVEIFAQRLEGSFSSWCCVE